MDRVEVVIKTSKRNAITLIENLYSFLRATPNCLLATATQGPAGQDRKGGAGAMQPGICKLCLKDKLLVNSHLMARGLYDYCRPPDGDPILLSSNVIMQSSRQLQHPLLCMDCDGSLSRDGEDWILPLLATIEGAFPFFTILQRIPPDITDGDSKLYAASRNPEINVSKLMHFAMGVFWKAAVHSWSGSQTARPLIELGEHTESVRTFLLGQSPFPRDLVLTIGVSSPPVKMISFHHPYRGSETAYHSFLFYVPGIEFALLVGRRIAIESKETCFATHPLHPILVCDLTSTIKDVIRAGTKQAYRAKNIERYLKKNES